MHAQSPAQLRLGTIPVLCGRVIPRKELPMHSAAASSRLPSLATAIDACRCPTPDDPTFIGTGYIPYGDDMHLLTIRFQWGSSQAYWLLSPGSSETWDLLDSWAAARRCSLMLDVGNQTVLAAREFAPLPAGMAPIREKAAALDDMTFIERAQEVIAGHYLELGASSDIGSIQRLDYVQVCLVLPVHLHQQALLRQASRTH